MKLKLFWQENCPKCPPAKELCTALEKDGVAVEKFNIEERDGLAESSFYSVDITPTLILMDDDENTICSWQGDMPNLADLRKQINK